MATTRNGTPYTFTPCWLGDGDQRCDKDATNIHLRGAGVYGVSPAEERRQTGDIYLDGFVPTLDDENNIISTSYWQPSSLYLTSSGMVAGSPMPMATPPLATPAPYALTTPGSA